MSLCLALLSFSFLIKNKKSSTGSRFTPSSISILHHCHQILKAPNIKSSNLVLNLNFIMLIDIPGNLWTLGLLLLNLITITVSQIAVCKAGVPVLMLKNSKGLSPIYLPGGNPADAAGSCMCLDGNLACSSVPNGVNLGDFQGATCSTTACCQE
ncbi:hypothetical protein CROQUDRAFT_668956 [Cronartium quercuum f. sp. fusiforme G11]|uniref:Uncharacterized protein n=1 Tax=Cronartium quercuum f. sp. fusiforme G11 TaxID=708437 RepID=A0A9P6TER6_9BASI|nr:hypothetical protein CROQUDRAFT_668956 [Cronartium quercuum f. sp. fusiforme G11]